MDRTTLIGPDFGGASDNAVAFCDTLGMVVWLSRGMKSARLTPEPVLRDTISVRLLDLPTLQYPQALDVATNGETFLTAYVRDVTAESLGLSVVMTDMSGREVAREPVVPSIADCRHPAVASDGSDYVVVWYQADDSPDTLAAYFSRVSREGVVLDPLGVRLWPPARGQRRPAVAWGDTGYAVVWRSEDEFVQGVILLPDGSVLDTAGFVIPQSWSIGTLRVAFDGQSFVVAWQDGEARLVAARVSARGVVIDETPVFIAEDVMSPFGLASLRDTTLAAWTQHARESTFVAARRLDGKLLWVDSAAIILADAETSYRLSQRPGYPSVAAVPGGFMASWSQLAIGRPSPGLSSPNIVCRRIPASGPAGDTLSLVVSRAANHHGGVRVASAGDLFFAVWEDYGLWDDSLPELVRGIRLHATQGVLDSASFAISEPGCVSPDVAYGHDAFLVAWTDRLCRLVGVRVDAHGRVLDTVPIVIRAMPRTAAVYPDVAWSDSAELYLVAWEEGDGVRYGARVRSDGKVLDSVPIRISDRPAWHRGPRVASNGSDFLVAFLSSLNAVARRVLATGAVLDSPAVYFGRYGTPFVAYGAGVYLATEPVDGVSWRVTPGGVRLDTAIHLPTPVRVCDVAYDGQNFLLVGGLSGETDSLVGVRISPQGTVVDSIPLTLVRVPELAGEPAVAGSGSDWLGLVVPVYEPYPLLSCRARYSVFRPLVGLADTPVPVQADEVVMWPSVTTGVLRLAAAVTAGFAPRLEVYSVAGRRVAGVSTTL
ncbi:hypothetical protein FJY71_04505, partial [candidate division WOR-3 bacterium]|nr:hypothetical protein [candidate division WOR-3 bacterium]